MIKKLFALASVSALGGVVSTMNATGCSSDPVPRASRSNEGAADPAPEKPTPSTSKPPVTTKADDDAESKTCLNPEPIDATKLPYVKVGTKPGACTEDENKALLTYLDGQLAHGADFSQADWAGAVSDKCAKCVFTEVDAPTWGVIINEKDAFYGYNFGGCMEMLTGKEACGRAVQQAMMCAEDACSKCDTERELNGCLADSDLVQRPCKDAVNAVEAECGKNVGTFLKRCNDGGIATLIDYQCVDGAATKAPAADGGG